MAEENIITTEKTVSDKTLYDLRKIVANTNINFLLGSGLSHPFLNILKDIEKELTKAEEKGNKEEILDIKKKYFKEEEILD